jgi:uncharacterized membrane protein YidH (DUF202 family)
LDKDETLIIDVDLQSSYYLVHGTHQYIQGEITMSQNRTTPRWVKVSVMIMIALIVLVVILHLTGNDFGGHMNHSALELGIGRLWL